MGRYHFIVMLLAVIILVSGCAGLGSREGKPMENLLPNGTFEEAESGQPLGWQAHTWGGAAKFDYSDVGRSGGKAVSVFSAAGADAAWYALVPVHPNTRYRLSGWIRTEGVARTTGRGALINVHQIHEAQTAAFLGTNDWTRVEMTFETDDQDEIQINCLLGGWGLARGRAWYDDLRLEALSRPMTAEAAVRIDLAATGAPISKYVYGQFIEHLGRCIYGGIWAEMLEDRKFYLAPGTEESPWHIVGGDGILTMETEDAYAGEHNPRIALVQEADRGLVQRGLGLVAGKDYVGRVVLRGPAGGSAMVSLIWGPETQQKQTFPIRPFDREFKTYQFRFTAGEDTDDGALQILARGTGPMDIGAVSLMPADNIHGMRRDTLALLKELDSPIYRWPGGNFVSGYDWHDGIGDPDRRPPRKNPAWKGIEHNDFGIDEFMIFCREIDTEPYVVVNTGLGELDMALEKLEYTNGGPDTPMGKRRAENGHTDPYNVHWWGIGNEMYGDWQLGHMPLEDYVVKNNAFAEAMRAKDPSIRLVAVGETGRWSETMLSNSADHMDLLSEHFYCGERATLLAHVRQVPRAIRAKAEAHRRYHATLPSLADKWIPICMDEWNYWYGPHLYGELGTQYFLKDALGIAAGLHEFFRHSDIMFMANYAQTVNVIGCIKTTKTAAAFDTTALPLMLYRKQFGTIPVVVEGEMGVLDIAAAWTEDRSALTLGVVNPIDSAQECVIRLDGIAPGPVACWRISGDDPQACNVPGETPQVLIEESMLEAFSGNHTAPPLSITLYRIPMR
jgi:alpha-L-arabinofuranosidase